MSPDRHAPASRQDPDSLARVPGFVVTLPQFEGPFDLLLSLIARRRLDVTELALAEVTDEFLQVMRADWELEHASEFLLVAATLLALKARRLLPHDQDEEDEDLELIEARDLLVARLLQYRAFKQAAAEMEALAQRAARCHPRVVALPPHLAGLLPALVAQVRPGELARLAARALSRRPQREVQTVHLHEAVPVGPELSRILRRLTAEGSLTFSVLVADVATDLPAPGGRGGGPVGPDEIGDPDSRGAAGTTAQEQRAGRARAVVVARFLALLILHREGQVDLSQDRPMGEITVALAVDADRASGMMGAADRQDLEEEFG